MGFLGGLLTGLTAALLVVLLLLSFIGRGVPQNAVKVGVPSPTLGKGTPAIGGVAGSAPTAPSSSPATATPMPAAPTIKTGTHIINIQTGTDFTDEQVVGEADTFTVGQTMYVVLTVATQVTNAQVVLKLYLDQLEDTSAALTPRQGTHAYAVPIHLGAPGIHRVEADYNGVPEASITFTVIANI